MTSTIDYAASTHFAPFSAPASTPSQLASSVFSSTPTAIDTAARAAASAASAAVARFEADFYPDWFDHVTYTFLALFATFIVVCYGMAWYKIRVADRKAEEQGGIDSRSGREGKREKEDDGHGAGTDGDSTDTDLERGEGPGWSSSSSSSKLAARSRGQPLSRAPCSEKECYDEESDLDSTPTRRRTRRAGSTSDTEFSSSSSTAHTATSDDDDLSPIRPSTTRRPLPRRGRTAAAEAAEIRAVRYSRRPGRSGDRTGIF